MKSKNFYYEVEGFSTQKVAKEKKIQMKVGWYLDGDYNSTLKNNSIIWPLKRRWTIYLFVSLWREVKKRLVKSTTIAIERSTNSKSKINTKIVKAYFKWNYLSGNRNERELL
jgi:hypothetical protein